MESQLSNVPTRWFEETTNACVPNTRTSALMASIKRTSRASNTAASRELPPRDAFAALCSLR